MEDTTLDFNFEPSKNIVYAGFWQRVLAVIIDGIILNIAGFILNYLIGTTDEYSITGTSGLFSWIYYALMESSDMQATLGKLAVGLKVCDEDGRRISFMKATGRYFAKILSALILFIGFIMVAFDEKKQGLHDKLARTLVIMR
jgi:uncharacterized RDD family membrane protein YckC